MLKKCSGPEDVREYGWRYMAGTACQTWVSTVVTGFCARCRSPGEEFAVAQETGNHRSGRAGDFTRRVACANPTVRQAIQNMNRRRTTIGETGSQGFTGTGIQIAGHETQFTIVPAHAPGAGELSVLRLKIAVAQTFGQARNVWVFCLRIVYRSRFFTMSRHITLRCPPTTITRFVVGEASRMPKRPSVFTKTS